MFGFGPSCDVEFELDRTGSRKSVDVLDDGKKVKQLIYYDGEDVGGTVSYVQNQFLIIIQIIFNDANN